MNRPLPQLKLVGFIAGCVLAALWLLGQRSSSLAPSGLLAIWLFACIAGEAFWLNAPGNGTISMALTLDIAALAILGHRGGIEVIAVSTLVAGIYPHRRPWYKIAFNTAQSTLAAAASLAAMDYVARGPGFDLMPVTLWWPSLLFAGAAFFLVNTILVAGVISLSAHLPLWRTWRDNFAYPFELASSLAQVTLAGFLLVAYDQLGPATLLLLVPLVGVLWYSSSREARARKDCSARTEPENRDNLRRAG